MLWVLKRKSQWDGSFEHPKHMLKIMGKKIYLKFYAKIFGLSKPLDSDKQNFWKQNFEYFLTHHFV